MNAHALFPPCTRHGSSCTSAQTDNSGLLTFGNSSAVHESGQAEAVKIVARVPWENLVKIEHFAIRRERGSGGTQSCRTTFKGDLCAQPLAQSASRWAARRILAWSR